MPDQTATCISSALTKIFCTFGIPEVFHSDQGRNFESLLLKETLKALELTSHTHQPIIPKEMAWWNASIVLCYRCYVLMLKAKKNGKSIYPQLCTLTAQPSTLPQVSFIPFDHELMFGRPPQQTPFEQFHSFDTETYKHHPQAELAVMRDFIETSLTESARTNYNKHSYNRKFVVGERVWLSIPTAKKLDPLWDGRWTITKVKGPLNMEVSDGNISKVVHVNRLCHCIQPAPTDGTPQQIPPSITWSPPQVDHFTEFYSEPVVTRRYPIRVHHPPQ